MAIANLSNTCEGTSGNAVTTSNTAGPNQFSAVTKSGTGATVNFSNNHAHTGTTSIQNNLPASVASATYLAYTSLQSDTQKFLRFYLYLEAYPTVNTRIAMFGGSGSMRSALQVTTGGALRTLNSGGGTLGTTTSSIPLNQWVRIEFEVTNISGTTGTVATRFYSGSNLEGWHWDGWNSSTEQSATQVSSNGDGTASLYKTGATVGGNIDFCYIGQSSSVTMTTQWQPYYDDIALSNISQPGPLNGTYLVVTADMQVSVSGNNIPPTTVSTQIKGLSPTPNLILMPGDITGDGDNNGQSTEYSGTWTNDYGALGPGNSVASIIYPVPGNHDWGDVTGQGNLTAYDTEFGTQGGSGTTPPHFISFDTSNGWHIIGLDSDSQWTGSINNSSTTYTAVSNDLASNVGKPIIAFWHHPRFSDGTNSADPGGTNDTTTVQDIWNLLRDYNADIVFNGHCHSYQRFPKFGKTAVADGWGIREFVVGTGGSGLFTLNSTQRSTVNSYQSASYDQLNSKWFGFLKVYLTPTSYSWEFVSQNYSTSEAKGLILDSGGPFPTNILMQANAGQMMSFFP